MKRINTLEGLRALMEHLKTIDKQDITVAELEQLATKDPVVKQMIEEPLARKGEQK